MGGYGLVGWLPSWTFTGLLAPVGLALVAAGWRSAPRRWLVWLALAQNTLLLAATIWAWFAP